MTHQLQYDSSITNCRWVIGLMEADDEPISSIIRLDRVESVLEHDESSHESLFEEVIKQEVISDEEAQDFQVIYHVTWMF